MENFKLSKFASRFRGSTGPLVCLKTWGVETKTWMHVREMWEWICLHPSLVTTAGASSAGGDSWRLQEVTVTTGLSWWGFSPLAWASRVFCYDTDFLMRWKQLTECRYHPTSWGITVGALIYNLLDIARAYLLIVPPPPEGFICKSLEYSTFSLSVVRLNAQKPPFLVVGVFEQSWIKCVCI